MAPKPSTFNVEGFFFFIENPAERLQQENDPEAIFRDLWSCEQILESEHREWLRLMIEGEWFG